MWAVADLLAAEPDPDLLGAAEYYAAAHDGDKAFRWLDRAYAAHIPQLVHVVANPMFEPIRSDARYGELLRRMGLPVRTGVRDQTG